jgi:hypothetical protein
VGDTDDARDDRDVPTGPSIPRRLAAGAANKPALAVLVVVLLVLSVGFFLAGVVFVADSLGVVG